MAYLTTGPVKKGSYVVVDKEELVTNGGFDTDTDWAKGTGWTIGAGVASCDGTQATLSYINEVYTFISGLEYIITLDVISVTSGTISVYYYDGTLQKASRTTAGRLSLTFTGDGTSNPFGAEADASFVGSIDNISVQLKNDIYRADRYTADMYDYDDTDNRTTAVLDIVYCTGNNSNGTVGHFYKCPSNNLDATTANLVNWQDLGTATNMSLLNPYFKDRTQFGITNKILATRKSDGTIKTEVCFVDTAIEDCGNAHVVMTDNGYSKISNGLYSKGADVVTPIGTWSTLNKGAYHPFFNAFGCSVWKDVLSMARAWHLASNLTSSTASTFDATIDGGSIIAQGNIGKTSWHPQGKFYDIIYPDQWIDLRIEANAVSEQDELNRVGTKAKSGGLDGIGGVVATVQFNIPLLGSGGSGVYKDNDNKVRLSVSTVSEIKSIIPDEKILNGDVSIFISNSSVSALNGVYNAKLSSEEGKIYDYATYQPAYYLEKTGVGVGFTSSVWNAATFDVMFTITLPHPSIGTALRTRMYGDPSSYPTAIKDRLASGLPLIGIEPILVD